MPYRSDRTPALVADVASEHPSVVGQVNRPDSLDRGRPCSRGPWSTSTRCCSGSACCSSIRSRWRSRRDGAAGFCQGSRHRPWPTRTGLAIWPALTAGWIGMRCAACGSEAVTERPERTAQGYRRFRCRACGKQLNERSGGLLNRTQYPSDVIALVVLWRLRYELSLRDLPEMFLVR